MREQAAAAMFHQEAALPCMAGGGPVQQPSGGHRALCRNFKCTHPLTWRPISRSDHTDTPAHCNMTDVQGYSLFVAARGCAHPASISWLNKRQYIYPYIPLQPRGSGFDLSAVPPSFCPASSGLPLALHFVQGWPGCCPHLWC